MLAKAKEKITSPKVNFVQADILQDWSFATEKYDLVSFSLVLEHIRPVQLFLKPFQKCVPGFGYAQAPG